MRAAKLAILLVLPVVNGCVLFTGSTDGYTEPDSGSSERTCSSAAACGDAAVCCLVTTSSTASTLGTCMASCAVQFPQLCASSAECGEAGACSMHTCTIDAGGGITFPLQACGEVQDCVSSP
ncbi:MAG: hypothetical protein WBY94_06700 [Polyangiaceae bacterium]